MSIFAENLQRLASHAEKGARLVARTFYRELRRAGFADRHIMAVADELLGCLTASLREVRRKGEAAAQRLGEPALGLSPAPAPSPEKGG